MMLGSHPGTSYISELVLKGQVNGECSAALSIRLTRLKPRGSPRVGAHQKLGARVTL